MATATELPVVEHSGDKLRYIEEVQFLNSLVLPYDIRSLLPVACHTSWARRLDSAHRLRYELQCAFGDVLGQSCVWSSALERYGGSAFEAHLSFLQPHVHHLR